MTLRVARSVGNTKTVGTEVSHSARLRAGLSFVSLEYTCLEDRICGPEEVL